MVAVTNINAYSFLTFSNLTSQTEDTEIGVFVCTLPPDSGETKLGGSNQVASPSEGKNTGLVLVSCDTWNSGPTAISGGVDIPEVLGCHFLPQTSCHCGPQKLLQ